MSDARVVKQLQQAHASFVAGRVDEAIAQARRAIAKVPAHVEGAVLLAQLQHAQQALQQERYRSERATVLTNGRFLLDELLRAAEHVPLLDALAATPRPSGRVRVEVDPLRV